MADARWTVSIIAAVVAVTAPARAQDSLAVSASFDASRWLSPDAPLELTLSRPVAPQEGRLAVLVGDLDVSGMLVSNGASVTYEPRAMPLPKGESDVVVYLVTPDASWHEVTRLPLRVLRSGGFEKAEVTPRLAVNNKGQVAEGHAPASNRPPRSEFQDFSMNIGLQTTHAANGWQLQSQWNTIGVSNREEALRFGERREQAPRLDLSDYMLTVSRGPMQVSAGHLSFGSQRHLLTGFASRGVVTRVQVAPAAKLELAGLNSTAIVGWSNLFGVSRANHRLLAANLGFDLVPARPGLVTLDALAVHGASLPQSGFSQGSVSDAEKSRGGGVQLTAALPSQRARIEAGFARTRFTNPSDPLLAQDATLVAVNPVTKNARFLDVNVGLIRSSLSPSLPASVDVVFRHERVDPLYRTLGMPGIRADILQNVVELQATLGPTALRASHLRGHDNLDRIGTILSTQTRTSTAGIDLPTSFLFGAGAPSWLPVLSYALMRLHQYGDSVPRAGGFPDAFVPDQLSINGTLSALAQGQSWRAMLRWDRSTQDNRQPGRENADFVNNAMVVALGLTPAAAFDVSVDVAFEKAESEERAATTWTTRLGTTLSWRATSTTALTAAFSNTHTDDDPRTAEQDARDVRLELSQRLNVFGARSGRASGQLFLRYGRQFGRQLDLFTNSSRRAWALSTGATLNLF